MTLDSDPPRAPTYLSRRFAVAWTLATGVPAVFLLLFGTLLNPEPVAILGGVALLASWLPVWWRAHTPRPDGPASAPAELERRVLELEERLDFAERLLTKQRDDQLRNPSDD